ncbi:MAG: hypothetical protein A2W74_09265 [Planctomycetes bacterium RIFCSPLOWO2_12_38_17]|nr:MAG: hypothetical protein A2W74_09265 [Planctomycetes bacterium RIFCSPLOWO2_12_38_17]
MKITFEPKKIDTLIQLAIQENIATGDITPEHLIPNGLFAKLQKRTGLLQGCQSLSIFPQSSIKASH